MQQAASMSENFDYRILVIEPTRLYRRILTSQFEQMELEADYATTGIDAKRIIDEKGKAIQLVICAAELPDMSGLTFALEARKKLGEEVPILLLSTVVEKQLIREALKKGLTEVILRDRLMELQPYLQRFANLSIEPNIRRPRVLYVEDAESEAELSRQILEQNGYRVEITASAERALNILNQENFDLIITDILLDGSLTGMNLIRHVRQSPEPLKHIPILAISGLNKQSQRIESLRLGATDFVTKPINYEELCVRMNNLIRTKRLFERVYEQERLLRKLAMTDALTELYNRHYLKDVMPKRIKESERHAHPLSIILVDIDRFKDINDEHGHLTGDVLLKEFATLLKDNCRAEDFAVRFGGEEFLLVLPYCALADAVNKAENLRAQIESKAFGGLSITASFGVAGKHQSAFGVSFEQLFDAADSALYKAKQNGRNRVESSPVIR